MSPVDHRSSRRMSIVIVPLVVVTAVAVVMVILSIASAYAQESDGPSTSLEPVGDLEGAEAETDGPAPSINNLIVVSDGESIEATTIEAPGETTAELAPATTETSNTSLPASGVASPILSVGLALSLLGALVAVANAGGKR